MSAMKFLFITFWCLFAGAGFLTQAYIASISWSLIAVVALIAVLIGEVGGVKTAIRKQDE